MAQHRRTTRRSRTLMTAVCAGLLTGLTAWQLEAVVLAGAVAAETPQPLPVVSLEERRGAVLVGLDPAALPDPTIIIAPEVVVAPELGTDPTVPAGPGGSGGDGGDGGGTAVTCHHNSIVDLSHAFQDGLLGGGAAGSGTTKKRDGAPENMCTAKSDNDGGPGEGKKKRVKKNENSHERSAREDGPRRGFTYSPDA